ncbi:MAG: hypothetical protein Q7U36_03620 [bacterium]|nr:hypothetical protein [bacterium]
MNEILRKIIFSSRLNKDRRHRMMEEAVNVYFGEGIKLFQAKDALGVARAPNGGFLDKPHQETFN